MLFKTIDQIDLDLAKRVRHLRKKKKLTQKQLVLHENLGD